MERLDSKPPILCGQSPPKVKLKNSDQKNRGPCSSLATHLSTAILLIFASVIHRWQNTEVDILQCSQCSVAICIAFHPNLDNNSYNELAQKYLLMLETSHENNCVFRSFAGRWLKVMKRLCDQHNKYIPTTRNGEQGQNALTNEAKTIVRHSVFVPPYFLSLSNQFLVFEDASDDGSVTFQRIELESSTIMKDLPKKSHFEVYPPNDLKDFVHIRSKPSARQNPQQIAYLLSTFGWHYDHSNSDSGGSCVKCNICLSKALLPSRKRRLNEVKADSIVKLHLVNSHRVYCPYVNGFSFGVEHKSDAGWKVVVKNLVKFAKTKKDGILTVVDLWGAAPVEEKSSSY